MEYIELTRLSIKSHPELNEFWVQDRIAENPKILGLGDVVLKDKERRQPRAGRLDLLLQDIDSTTRYEVEVQLGSVDESHIIRTVEYWDIERKRYPQYDHVGVIVAEDVSSRFLNVISLFNGHIPLVAIQMNALSVGDKVGLVFTTVVDQMTLGFEDDDEAAQEPTDRAYWESRATKNTVQVADDMLPIAQEFEDQVELNYTKFYIGLAINGQSKNFIKVKPQKAFTWLRARMPESEEVVSMFEDSGLVEVEYQNRWKEYRIKLKPHDVESHRDVLRRFVEMAHESYRN